MKPAIRLGSLESRHRSRLEEIVRAASVFSEAEVAVALELFDETFSGDGTSDYEFIGAFDGESLIGYACFGATPATDRTFDLYWIAVHPGAQGRGAGAALIADVERILRERRARLLIVETSSRDDYAPTRSFYLKRGFEEAARLEDFYASGDDRVMYVKRLAPAMRPSIHLSSFSLESLPPSSTA